MSSWRRDHVGRDVLKRDPDANSRIPWSQIISALAGYAFAYIIGVLGDMSSLDIVVFGLIVAVCTWLGFEAAGFHRATKETQVAADRMEAALDKLNTKSLTVNHRIEEYTINARYVFHKTTIILTNNTSEVCKQFRYGLCRESVLVDGRFRILVDGHALSDVPKSDFDLVRNERRSANKDGKIICRYLYDFYIPLELLPGKTCTIEIEDEGGAAMNNLLRCKEDMAAVWVHLPTHILEIAFRLNDEMSEEYKLEPYRSIGTSSAEVYDHCENRMNMYEAQICDRNHPRSDGRTVRWTIMEPVVGFSYRLYLMMSHKDTSKR